MILWTQSSMTAAQQLYVKHGFVRVPHLDFSKGGPIISGVCAPDLTLVPRPVVHHFLSRGVLIARRLFRNGRGRSIDGTLRKLNLPVSSAGGRSANGLATTDISRRQLLRRPCGPAVR